MGVVMSVVMGVVMGVVMSVVMSVVIIVGKGGMIKDTPPNPAGTLPQILLDHSPKSCSTTPPNPAGPLPQILQDHSLKSCRNTPPNPAGPLPQILQYHSLKSCRTTPPNPAGPLPHHNVDCPYLAHTLNLLLASVTLHWSPVMPSLLISFSQSCGFKNVGAGLTSVGGRDGGKVGGEVGMVGRWVER